MDRVLLNDLKNWLTASDRKPLVIRGARQVGKTWLVRNFAKFSGKQLVEFNFEYKQSSSDLFASNDVQEILLNIEAAINQKINPENCLLFLDEIQVVPHLLSKLRWFAENLPQLPVIATGSLLEFTLTDHSFSMPVGRINYMHLEPLSFEEFLLAKGQNVLCEYLASYDFSRDIPAVIHNKLIGVFREYILVGGLPAAVAGWINEQSFSKVSQIQHDLLATYRDDFFKYRGRFETEVLDEIMASIPIMLGGKFVFSRVNVEKQAGTLKKALNLLCKAKICHLVRSCAANGIPFASEIKENCFKAILIDVGLCSTSLGLNFNNINYVNEITLINSGGIAEQVIGQILRTINPSYVEPSLYYWNRDVPGSSAEIDYVIQHGKQVIPIEVKAGTTGSLKSLHYFMGAKKFPLAVRINSDVPSKVDVDVKSHEGNQIKYKLISIPFYLAGQIHRLLDLE